MIKTDPPAEGGVVLQITAVRWQHRHGDDAKGI